MVIARHKALVGFSHCRNEEIEAGQEGGGGGGGEKELTASARQEALRPSSFR